MTYDISAIKEGINAVLKRDYFAKAASTFIADEAKIWHVPYHTMAKYIIIKVFVPADVYKAYVDSHSGDSDILADIKAIINRDNAFMDVCDTLVNILCADGYYHEHLPANAATIVTAMLKE